MANNESDEHKKQRELGQKWARNVSPLYDKKATGQGSADENYRYTEFCREAIPARIKQAAEEEGLTIRNLAVLAGYDESTLRKKLTTGAITAADLFMLAHVLQVSVYWFVQDGPQPLLPGYEVRPPKQYLVRQKHKSN